MPGAASHRGARPGRARDQRATILPPPFGSRARQQGGSATLARADPPVSPGRRVPSLIWRVAAASAGAPLVVGSGAPATAPQVVPGPGSSTSPLPRLVTVRRSGIEGDADRFRRRSGAAACAPVPGTTDENDR
jgi:hypothetical protein